MNSFLVCSKELNRFSPSRNPAEGALLAGLKEEGRLPPRPWSTRTNPRRLGLAQGGGLVRRGWLTVFSTLAIGFVWLASPLRAQFAYVANGDSNNVSAYSIGADGFLTPVPGSPFAAGNVPESVAVDPTAKFAYVANALSHNVSAYRIGADGALKPVEGSPFAAGKNPISVAVDPTGKFSYVANYHGDNVSAYSIGADGALTQLTSLGSPFAAGNSPVSVAVDPTAKFAYVAVDPTAKFAYVVNGGTNNVSAYSIGADGALTPVPGSPFAAGFGPESLAVDPTGKFAYVANQPGKNFSAYSIGANGALTPVPGSPFAAEGSSESVAVDPTGKFAYVANRFGKTVSAYSIAADGALTPVTGSPFPAGSTPISVAITQLVPFASSFAKLEIAKDRFDLKESFTLGANSNGIKPVKENVTLQIGTFSVMIPAGSFKKTLEGKFVFVGVISGVSLDVLIVPLVNNIFTFNAVGTGVDLTGLAKPVTVVLTIGIDTGSTTAAILP